MKPWVNWEGFNARTARQRWLDTAEFTPSANVGCFTKAQTIHSVLISVAALQAGVLVAQLGEVAQNVHGQRTALTRATHGVGTGPNMGKTSITGNFTACIGHENWY